MAWSDKARAAAALVRRRKLTYTRNDNVAHVRRDVMAAYLKEARSTGLRGRGKSVKAVEFARAYTNVKGAHFVDQGLKGLVWREKGSKAGVPKWAASKVKYFKRRR